MDCSVVSEAMRPFGGFPSKIFVREEMKTMWSILVDGLVTQQSKYVMIGSPGVGKSILTVLLCFYLARDLHKPVFLARQLNGAARSVGGVEAICIHPGGAAVVYPGYRYDIVDLGEISHAFVQNVRENVGDQLMVVLDGWSQAEMVGSMQSHFAGFHLLATSVVYNPKSSDCHHPVVLPAWNDDALGSLWELYGPKGVGSPTFKEQLYYSGGNARDLLNPTDEVRLRFDWRIVGLERKWFNWRFPLRDCVRRCYLTHTRPNANLKPSEWNYVVDSAYVLNSLNRLQVEAPLDVYEESLSFAEVCGPTRYGLMFEALVYKLFHVPNMCITFQVQPYSRPGALTDAYESIALGKKMCIECCSDADEAEAMDRLGNLKLDMNRGTYWRPTFPIFSAVDAVLFSIDIKTVFYIQTTVAQEHDLNCDKLMMIHEAAKKTLEKSTDAKGWTFKYIAVTRYQSQAENLVLKDGGRPLSVQSVGEVSISKGYVTYASE